MAKAHVHAESSARRYGGEPSDYMPIHLLLDSAKAALADVRFRALTHNSWFIREVVPKVFGDTITNSAGHKVSTVAVAEDHVSEDYGGFIPSVQDFLQEMELKDWMLNGKGRPPSQAKIVNRKSEDPKNAVLDGAAALRPLYQVEDAELAARVNIMKVARSD